jgi:uracil-DNA glycosylase family 4
MGADQHIDWNATAASVLDWWREAGVDTLIDEAPHDWLAQAPDHGSAARAPAPAVDAPAALPADLQAFEAWRIGASAPDAAWGTPLAPQGDAAPGLMILVDMPERGDAEAGRLLDGPAGALFDRMLAAIGRTRADVYLTALAVARPVTGRIAPEHLKPLAELARHHIALTRPKRLLLLGNAASRAVLGADVSAARGNLHVVNHDGGQSRAVASYHPRFLLERPACKGEAWVDLQLLIRGIEE